MAYQTVFDGSTDKTIKLTGGEHPTSIEGYFIGTKEVPSDYGVGKLHIFQTPEGNVGVWGKTRLDNLLTSALLGQMVKATFTGMINPSKKGRKPSYGYKVQHDPENLIDVSSINLTAKAADDEEGAVDSDDEGSYESEVTYSAPVAPKAGGVSVPAKKTIQELIAARNKKA